MYVCGQIIRESTNYYVALVHAVILNLNDLNLNKRIQAVVDSRWHK
jgi:hypothetical protein